MFRIPFVPQVVPALVGLAAALLLASPIPALPPDPPNLIFIMADDKNELHRDTHQAMPGIQQKTRRVGRKKHKNDRDS
ncbi:MAG: hypothetical protein FJ276_19430 [Planctomycetes bacterium]|nr:hypothetical protein [Planctomycetota bacterium]